MVGNVRGVGRLHGGKLTYRNVSVSSATGGVSSGSCICYIQDTKVAKDKI